MTRLAREMFLAMSGVARVLPFEDAVSGFDRRGMWSRLFLQRRRTDAGECSVLSTSVDNNPITAKAQ